MHLLELADELQRRLSGLGRLQWAREECEPLELSSDERDLGGDLRAAAPCPGPGSSPRRSRGAGALARAHRRARDRPVQSILHDAALVEIAKRRPDIAAQLEQIRGVAPSACTATPPRVLQVIAEGRDRAHRAAAARRKPPAPRPERRAADRAWRGPGARPHTRSRACLRAAGRQSRPPGDRRSQREGLASPTCARCAAGGASSSALSCWICSTAASRCPSATGSCGYCAEHGIRCRESLFDVLVHFEERHIHRDHDEPDDPADHDDHQGSSIEVSAFTDASTRSS